MIDDAMLAEERIEDGGAVAGGVNAPHPSFGNVYRRESLFRRRLVCREVIRDWRANQRRRWRNRS